jgi:hypothetical protein
MNDTLVTSIGSILVERESGTRTMCAGRLDWEYSVCLESDVYPECNAYTYQTLDAYYRHWRHTKDTEMSSCPPNV